MRVLDMPQSIGVLIGVNGEPWFLSRGDGSERCLLCAWRSPTASWYFSPEPFATYGFPYCCLGHFIADHAVLS